MRDPSSHRCGGQGESLTTAPGARNDDARSPSVARFTPHTVLLSYLARWHGGTGALRAVLSALLWRAGKRGYGERTRPHEAMCWRSVDGLGDDAGVGRSSVKRAFRTLSEIGFLRWELVHPGQRLPTGARARGRVAVVYVDLDRVGRAVGLGPSGADGTPGASKVHFGPYVRSNLDCAPPENPGSLSTDVKSSRSLTDRDLTTTTRTTEVIVEGSDGPTKRLLERWWERLGRPKLGDPPRADLMTAVELAIESALRAGAPESDLTDAIDGRADARLGGAAFDFCARTTDGIWGPSLFFAKGRISGVVKHFVEEAKKHRDRAERVRDRRASAPADKMPTVAELREVVAHCKRGGFPVPAVVRELLDQAEGRAKKLAR